MIHRYILSLVLLLSVLPSPSQPPIIAVPDTFESIEASVPIYGGSSGSRPLQYFHKAAVNKGNVFRFCVPDPIVVTFSLSDFSYNRSINGDPLPSSDFGLELHMRQTVSTSGDAFSSFRLPFRVRGGTYDIYCSSATGTCSLFVPPGEYEISYTGFSPELLLPIDPVVSLASVAIAGVSSSVTLHYSASAYTVDEAPTSPYPSIHAPSATPPVVLPASSGRGSIVRRTYRSPDGSAYDETTEYYDGLGRLDETVLTGITPDRKNLVSVTEHDGWGNETGAWLPGPADASCGNGYTARSSAMSSSVTANGDVRPYVHTVYELSPLGRIHGYSIENGVLEKGTKKYNISGQIHTHQSKSFNATPSYNENGDAGVSHKMGGLPIFSIGHDNLIHGLYYDFGNSGYHPLEFI